MLEKNRLLQSENATLRITNSDLSGKRLMVLYLCVGRCLLWGGWGAEQGKGLKAIVQDKDGQSNEQPDLESPLTSSSIPSAVRAHTPVCGIDNAVRFKDFRYVLCVGKEENFLDVVMTPVGVCLSHGRSGNHHLFLLYGFFLTKT